MTNMTPATASERRLTSAIQTAIGAKPDGIIGPASAVDLAVEVGADCWPVTLKLFSQPVIVCKDIVIANPSKGLRSFANSLSGSFSYNRAPCSILVNNGRTLWQAACHAWLGKPECVLYRLQDGSFGVKRCLSAGELPTGVKWAVGGMGLLKMYDPEAEGFAGRYADVLRRTNHTALGVKRGMVYLIYCANMTARQVNDYCKQLQLDNAIMLDGGHVAAINGGESFARINTSQVQYYMLQGVTE